MHIKSQVGQWKKKEKNLKCPETNKKKIESYKTLAYNKSVLRR